MKKKQLLLMLNVIQEILKVSKVSELNWKLIQNKNILKVYKEEIDEFLNQSEEFKQYENKRIELCNKYAKKDKDGNPIIININDKFIYDGLENNKEFIFSIKKLNKEYEDIIKIRNEQIKHYDEIIMNEEIEIDNKLKKIKISLIPDNIICGELLEYLFPIIEE